MNFLNAKALTNMLERVKTPGLFRPKDIMNQGQKMNVPREISVPPDAVNMMRESGINRDIRVFEKHKATWPLDMKNLDAQKYQNKPMFVKDNNLFVEPGNYQPTRQWWGNALNEMNPGPSTSSSSSFKSEKPEKPKLG